MEEYKTGVYLWRNLVSGKVYVGGAYDSFSRRLSAYKSKFQRGKVHNPALQAAWNKYGAGNLEFEILECCPQEKVAERETWWISFLDACNKNWGYNICPIGRSKLGVRHTPETCAKMSAAKKGKPGLRTGAVLSDETKVKISASKLGTKMSEEARANMSVARKGKKQSSKHRAAECLAQQERRRREMEFRILRQSRQTS